MPSEAKEWARARARERDRAKGDDYGKEWMSQANFVAEAINTTEDLIDAVAHVPNGSVFGSALQSAVRSIFYFLHIIKFEIISCSFTKLPSGWVMLSTEMHFIPSPHYGVAILARAKLLLSLHLLCFFSFRVRFMLCSACFLFHFILFLYNSQFLFSFFFSRFCFSSFFYCFFFVFIHSFDTFYVGLTCLNTHTIRMHQWHYKVKTSR